MRLFKNLPAALLGACIFAGPAMAEDPLLSVLAEDVLRGLVTFGPDEQLKMADCVDARQFSCTYIWGLPDPDDATRIALGGKPDGNRVLVIAVQSPRASDFDRVLSVYSDAVPVPEFGAQSVWSAARGQLSLRTDDGLIIHVNTLDSGAMDTGATAIAVAHIVLASR